RHLVDAVLDAREIVIAQALEALDPLGVVLGLDDEALVTACKLEDATKPVLTPDIDRLAAKAYGVAPGPATRACKAGAQARAGFGAGDLRDDDILQHEIARRTCEIEPQTAQTVLELYHLRDTAADRRGKANRVALTQAITVVRKKCDVGRADGRMPEHQL